eukprot:272228-Alexandrium_andersonii.AAC.1
MCIRDSPSAARRDRSPARARCRADKRTSRPTGPSRRCGASPSRRGQPAQGGLGGPRCSRQERQPGRPTEQ